MGKKNKGTIELVAGSILGFVAMLGALSGSGCVVGACAIGAAVAPVCPICAAAAGILISLGIWKKHEQGKNSK